MQNKKNNNINLKVQLEKAVLIDVCQAKANWIFLYLSNQKRLAFVMNDDIYLIWEILQ